MRAPRLDGVTAGAALALSLALAAGMVSAAAEQATPTEVGMPRSESVNLAPPSAAPLDVSTSAVEIKARIPLPDFPDLAPLTAADVGIESVATPPATVETTGGIGEPAGTPAPKTGTAIATAPAAMPSDEVIMRGIPLPEPAGVAPPTIKDIGKIPLAAADVAVAEKLKELVTGKLDRFVDRKRERSALEEFYRARDYAPLWIELGVPTPRMTAAIARLKSADADGLDANDYSTPDLKVLGKDADALAQAELKLTNAVLIFARHAQSGRVTVSRISNNIEFNPPVPEPADVLAKIVAAKEVAKALDGFNPPHDGFKALKAKLAELRGKSSEPDVAQIPSGKTLKVQKKPMEDARVPLLRQRLGIEGAAADTQYDAKLAEAVKEFQKQKGLSANGVLSQGTVDALNGRSKSRDTNTIISNMERWRWLPRDLGKAYVMVNVPDFTLKTVQDGVTLFHTRIVVGKPGTPSPSFSAAIENILVNPTWHVPQSIIYGEYLPALQEDPGVLARMGLIMEREQDGTISIRQPPGERNALGRIKFNFPNRFQVYLHDTPDKKLFANDRRAFSHGCMRVQNPDKFGEVLLSIAMPQERYTAERLTRLYGTSEHWLKFKKPIPVHLVYMNAYVDADGKLVVREDLYGYDGRVQAALRGEYMAIAERSQRVTPGQPVAARGRNPRQFVQEYPDRGFRLPWFQ